jgi:dihydroflavonol-4-reductase
MRVFVTGGTGFIGGHVVAKLRERGDQAVCLVRDRDKGRALAESGCEIVPGDLGDSTAIRQGMEGCDAAIHGAAVYEVGIPKKRRPALYEANVLGTERVLRAALDAKVPKVVYISTVAAFGNTNGKVVEEGYEHDRNYTSYYDETKHLAHLVARDLIEDEGLPCVIVQPGGVYGPEDHSELGNLITQYTKGRLPLVPFPDLGINFVHVDDVADGVLLALDRGKVGESYVLGGQIGTNRELFQTLAKVLGRKPPTRALPTGLVKAMAPVGSVVGPLLGFPPNMREVLSVSDGVTFWAKHDKAIAELGYSPRGLEAGLRDTLAAEGKLPAAA